MVTVSLLKQINSTLGLTSQKTVSVRDIINNIQYLKAKAAGNTNLAKELKIVLDTQRSKVITQPAKNISTQTESLRAVNIALNLAPDATDTLDAIRALKISSGEL